MSLTILTINKVTYLFKQWAESQRPLINGFGYGPIWDFGTSKKMDYPAMWVDVQSDSYITISNRVQQPTMAFNIMFCDQINNQPNTEDENGYESDNRKHIISDTYQLGQDFITYLINDLKPVGISVQSNITTTRVEDDTQDKVCGWVFGFQLDIRHYNCGSEAEKLLGDFNDDWNWDFNN